MTNYDKLEREKQKVRYGNIKNAIWLLSQSFSKGKHKLSFSEKVSFNTIVDLYEKNKKENLQNNELFAKMFIFVYSHMLKYYKATLFDDIPKKAIYNLLDKPISYHIERFTQELNDNEVYERGEKFRAKINYDKIFVYEIEDKIKKQEDILSKLKKRKEVLNKLISDNKEKPFITDAEKKDVDEYLDAMINPLFDTETVQEQLHLIINNYLSNC